MVGRPMPRGNPSIQRHLVFCQVTRVRFLQERLTRMNSRAAAIGSSIVVLSPPIATVVIVLMDMDQHMTCVYLVSLSLSLCPSLSLATGMGGSFNLTRLSTIIQSSAISSCDLTLRAKNRRPTAPVAKIGKTMETARRVVDTSDESMANGISATGGL